MSERKILSKILRLDKYIYIDLINLDNALQKGIFIYITITSLNTFPLLAPALLYFETVGILSSRKIVESDISGRFEGSSPRRSSRCKPHPAPRRNKQPYRTGSP